MIQDYLDKKKALTKCLYARMMPNGFYVPCGKCSRCRKNYARDMAFRCEQEAFDKYVYNVLLTYDDDHLPTLGGRPCLNRVHVQDFLKRFRSWHDDHTGCKLRFFGVGEYGGKKGRPHYHIIFFCDKKLEDPENDKQNPLSYINSILDDKWRHGAVDIEPMNDVGGSVRYFTQYLLTYDREDKNYVKPFRMCSRGKGIGYRWLERTRPFQRTAVERNFHIIKKKNEETGRTYYIPIPRYYKRKYIPEINQIASADDYYFKGKELLTFYNKLPDEDKHQLCVEFHRMQLAEKRQQSESYRKAKVHENSRSAHRVFASNAKRRKC